MKKRTLMGSLLSKVQFERRMAKEQASRNLTERNKIPPSERDNYRMIESSLITADGTEVTEMRLWKLIDREVITMSTEVKTDYKGGLYDREDVSEERD